MRSRNVFFSWIGVTIVALGWRLWLHLQVELDISRSEAWAQRMGFRPMVIRCDDSVSRLAMGQNVCRVTASDKEQRVFVFRLGCDQTGCTYWSMDRIR